jgi:bacterioferritin
MIMGYHRIPIQKWFRDQANESMAHTTVIGEKITALGGHPPMITEGIEESNVHAVNQILQETLDFEEETLKLYKKLADQSAKQGDVALEELAREFVRAETEHCEEVRKMLHKPE